MNAALKAMSWLSKSRFDRANTKDDDSKQGKKHVKMLCPSMFARCSRNL